MKTDPFSAEIIQGFFEGQLSEKQHQEILTWLSSLTEQQQQEFMEKHQNFLESTPMDPLTGELSGFQVIEKEILRSGKNRQKFRLWSLSAAAVLLLCSGLWFLSNTGKQSPAVLVVRQAGAQVRMLHIRNQQAQIQHVVLPDSSTVNLYPGASLEYPENFHPAKRELKLSGKAFFKVRHQVHRPFSVKTAAITTVVLGTSFWIDAPLNLGTVSVKVKTGKVGVVHRQQTLFLLPLDQATFNPVKGTLLSVKRAVVKPVKAIGQPLSEALVFNGTPLEQVVKVLNESFKQHIVLQENVNAQFPISLNTRGKTLKEILEEIKSQTPVKYEITRHQINISKQE
jgi:ferric-dicitrate binding protein FerR (iron transport regulator)